MFDEPLEPTWKRVQRNQKKIDAIIASMQAKAAEVRGTVVLHNTAQPSTTVGMPENVYADSSQSGKPDHAAQLAQNLKAEAELIQQSRHRITASDKLKLHGLGQLLDKIKADAPRAELVMVTKAAIAAGTYEDDHKLDVPADRLLDDLLKVA